MASLLARDWIYATVPIDNPQGESGTGFLVSREIGEGQCRVFLVTNKHVICKDPAARSAVHHVTCHFNTKEPDGTQGTVFGQVPLANNDGSKRFREHPDPDTDVYAVEVTDVMKLNTKIDKRWVGYDSFADEPRRAELDITVGEDIVTIGYPLGLRQGDTNFPLVRQGVIATKIGTHLKDKITTPVATGCKLPDSSG
jgi:hypothetical protein